MLSYEMSHVLAAERSLRLLHQIRDDMMNFTSVTSQFHTMTCMWTLPGANLEIWFELLFDFMYFILFIVYSILLCLHLPVRVKDILFISIWHILPYLDDFPLNQFNLIWFLFYILFFILLFYFHFAFSFILEFSTFCLLLYLN